MVLKEKEIKAEMKEEDVKETKEERSWSRKRRIQKRMKKGIEQK